MPPPFLLGVSLLAWGWLAERPFAGAVLAAAVEGVPFLKRRWHFEDREFERITDLTSIGFALFAGWTWLASRDLAQAILDLIAWLPALLAPLAVMQRLSANGRFPLSALFWSLRRRRETPARTISVDYPYFCHVLIASAAVAPGDARLGVACAALGAYALWPRRRAGAGMAAWGAAMGAVAGVAVASGWAMITAQQLVEARVVDYFRDRAAAASRADRARTAIGELGSLAQPGRIVLRVAAPTVPVPRLRDGVFDTYQAGVWYASAAPVRTISPTGTARWVLAPRAGPHRARISLWLPGGRGALPLPEGTARLDALNAGAVQGSAHGTVLVAEGPAFLDFTAVFDGAGASEGPPTPRDLALPIRLAPVLRSVATEAGVVAVPPAHGARAVEDFFHRRFAYTLRLGSEGQGPRTLEAFLTTDRRGHCEYFATAATLLLREAGVPARYVTGYAVHEWSDRERAFVVRARDGHAWTEAWVDGRWQAVDATPPAWRSLESAGTAATPVLDTLSWLFHRFTRWRHAPRDADAGPSAWWLLMIAPMAGWVAWGVMRRSRRVAEYVPSSVGAGALAGPGPAVTALEQALAKRGFVRRPSQSLRGWIGTLPEDRLPERARLIAWAERHDRARYDPAHRAGQEEAMAALLAEARALARSLEVPPGTAP